MNLISYLKKKILTHLQIKLKPKIDTGLKKVKKKITFHKIYLETS